MAVTATEGAGVPRTGDGDTAAGALEPEQMLGRYRIEALLGQGGMGAVYRAHDTDLRRHVAIKVLRAGGERDDLQQRLLREAQAMAQLSHPNLITVFDVGTFQGNVFIAMEYVRGETLEAYLAAPGRDWRARMGPVIDAGRGLVAAHDAGMVHRDFKPHNVLVTDSGRVHVVDFGLARALVSDDAGERTAAPTLRGDVLSLPLTQTGEVLGTPAYMSPEQFRGRAVDARSDQFSFGVTLYEALYRQRPFAGDNVAELADAVLAGRVRPPSADSDVPVAVGAVVDRCLRADPAERFPDMQAALDALAAASQRRKPRWRPLLWVAAAGVVLAAGVVAVQQVGDGDPPVARVKLLKKAPAADPSADRDDDPDNFDLDFNFDFDPDQLAELKKLADQFGANPPPPPPPVPLVPPVEPGPHGALPPAGPVGPADDSPVDYEDDDAREEALVTVFEAHRDAVDLCVAAALRRDPAHVPEEITIELRITPRGVVARSKLVETERAHRALAGCVASAARGWRFPPPEDGEPVTVKHEIVVDPR